MFLVAPGRLTFAFKCADALDQAAQIYRELRSSLAGTTNGSVAEEAALAYLEEIRGRVSAGPAL